MIDFRTDSANSTGPKMRDELFSQIEDRTATLGVVGLGYVGLPLPVEMAKSGYRLLGFDASPAVVEGIRKGESHIQDVPREVLRALVGESQLKTA
jgi:UDP-N-acetyl-D-glucosamine dehydrogenase